MHNQTIMLYTLSLYNVTCQLYLNKAGGKSKYYILLICPLLYNQGRGQSMANKRQSVFLEKSKLMNVY